jgi:hypothetical protein
VYRPNPPTGLVEAIADSVKRGTDLEKAIRFAYRRGYAQGSDDVYPEAFDMGYEEAYHEERLKAEGTARGSYYPHPPLEGELSGVTDFSLEDFLAGVKSRYDDQHPRDYYIKGKVK